ncbi:phage head-tail joining protein [Thauera aromatica]|uniref:phage head-tail joining protein n=1 Tax=Thauera aromatica TaxID=59405 RepID=UPI001FFC7CA3|nr:hypothetical protein [Thauera aromatica]MCK2097712.1 hypothetical protein [Thauera aromatica]
MTLEQLKAQREALQAACFNGVLTVKAGDKWVTYKSDAELQSALTLSEPLRTVTGTSFACSSLRRITMLPTVGSEFFLRGGTHLPPALGIKLHPTIGHA